MTLSIRRVVLTAATAVLLGLAAIGAAQVAASAGDAGAAPPAAFSAETSADVETGADATTDAGTLAVELDAVLAAEQSAAPNGQLRAGRGALRHLAAWRRLVHATVVVDLPDKGLTTIQLDHGTISAVSADSLSIAEAGGTSVTLALGAETRVRRSGEKAAVTDLKVGDEVFVMSRVESDGSEAYLVVVPRT